MFIYVGVYKISSYDVFGNLSSDKNKKKNI